MAHASAVLPAKKQHRPHVPCIGIHGYSAAALNVWACGRKDFIACLRPRRHLAGFENSYYRDLGGNRSTIILSNRDTLDTDELYQALDALVDKHVGE